MTSLMIEFLDTARYAIIAFATAGVLSLIALMNKRARPTEGEIRTIRPNRPLIVIFAVLSLGLGIFGAYVAYYFYITFRYSQIYIPAALALFFIPSGLCILGYLNRSFDVTWDETGIEGPTSYWLPPIGRGRARINYCDIKKAGTDWGSSNCIWDENGTKIMWSYLYRGHNQIDEHLEKMRPDLYE